MVDGFRVYGFCGKATNGKGTRTQNVGKVKNNNGIEQLKVKWQRANEVWKMTKDRNCSRYKQTRHTYES